MHMYNNALYKILPGFVISLVSSLLVYFIGQRITVLDSTNAIYIALFVFVVIIVASLVYLNVTNKHKDTDVLVNALRDSIFVVDEHGDIMSANKEALDVLNYTQEEIVGKPISEVIDP
jgi:PAS domain-containing protein